VRRSVDQYLRFVRDLFAVADRFDSRHAAVLGDLVDDGIVVLVDPEGGSLFEQSLPELIAINNVAAAAVGQHLPDAECFVPVFDLVDVAVHQHGLVVRDGVHIDRAGIFRRIARAFDRIAAGDKAGLFARFSL